MGLLVVPLLAGAALALGAVLAVHTLSETSFRVGLAVALYAVAPTLALVAAVTAASRRRGRVFFAGVTIGALLLLPPGLAVASTIS